MLSFIPTPIGHLGDITIRSLERLSQAKIVFCEDTRVSKQLFQLLINRYPQFIQQQEREFIALHHHNQHQILNSTILDKFQEDVVYISDAGSPGISDPGIELVNFAIQNNIDFEVLPGATALSVATLLSGFSDRQLLFWGFLPHKGRERANELNTILNSGWTTLIYESPHRIKKLLNELLNLAPEREIFLGRELTKKFEERLWGRPQIVIDKLTNIKGEFVVVIKGLEKNLSTISQKDIEELPLKPKEKAKLISKLTGENVKEIYNRLLNNN